MDGLALLAEAHSVGLEVRSDGGRLIIRGPRRAEALAVKLIEHKAQILRLLTRRQKADPLVEAQITCELATWLRAGSPDFFESVARLLSVPLEVFARHGQPIEVHVPWWPDETLFFVPSVREAEWLHLTEGIAPYRCWTAAELSSLFEEDESPTPEALGLLMIVRREFDGELVGLRPRHDAAADHLDAQPLQRSTYAGPWPDALPELGTRTVSAYKPCIDCGEGSWGSYGGLALCLRCARRREA